MYGRQYVTLILLFLLTAAGAEWFDKSDATVSFFISSHDSLEKSYSYPQAQEFCRTLGGGIASVLSKEEEDIFLWRLPQKEGSRGYFIGLEVDYSTGQPIFRWDDGSPYNYSNWDASEHFDELPCTAYIYNDTSKTWNWKTSDCEGTFYYSICKRNLSAIITTIPAVLHSSTITSQESSTSFSYQTGISNTEVNTDMSSESVSGNAIQANALWIGIGASLGVAVVIILIIVIVLIAVLRRKEHDKGNNHDEIEPTIYDDNSIAMTNIQINNNGFGNNKNINVNQSSGQNNQDVITNENDNLYTDNSTKDNSKTHTQEELEGMYAQVNKPDTNINDNQMPGNITKTDNHSRGVTDKPSLEELEDMYSQVNKPIAAVKTSMSGIKPGYDNHGSNVGTLVPGQHAITTLGLSDEPDGELEFIDNLIYCS